MPLDRAGWLVHFRRCCVENGAYFQVFLIPNLIKGFDSLLADGTIIGTSSGAPPAAQTGGLPVGCKAVRGCILSFSF